MDRAALDAALALGVGCGGWCPAGRVAEDGVIPAHYPLSEAPSSIPAVRTRWNVRDSDATLVLSPRPLGGGTLLTQELAATLRRPLLVADPFTDAPAVAVAWLLETGAARLNVAGPRESEAPGIYAASRRWLEAVLAALPPA